MEEMMLTFRWSAVGFMCLLLAAAVWGGDEEKKTENEKSEHATARDVMAKAKIDLLKALETAQAKMPQGKPMKASVEEEDEKHMFEIHFLVGEKVKSVEIDAATGTVLKVEDDEDEGADEIAVAKKILQLSKTSFSQAISTAKGRVKDGKPFSVELEMEDNKPMIEVELLEGAKVMKVEIDAMTGKVMTVVEEKE
jgi:uncharacterized membrane protein YkoI